MKSAHDAPLLLHVPPLKQGLGSHWVMAGGEWKDEKRNKRLKCDKLFKDRSKVNKFWCTYGINNWLVSAPITFNISWLLRSIYNYKSPAINEKAELEWKMISGWKRERERGRKEDKSETRTQLLFRLDPPLCHSIRLVAPPYNRTRCTALAETLTHFTACERRYPSV